MKIKKLFIVLFLAAVGTLQAQQHLPESKSLVGMWRLMQVRESSGGETFHEKLGLFKVINSDGTFYIFMINNDKNRIPELDLVVNSFGTYTITSDSTFTEHVIKNHTVPVFNNSDAELRYKFAPGSNNNRVYMIWKSPVNEDWIPEMWERVIFPQRKEETQNI